MTKILITFLGITMSHVIVWPYAYSQNIENVIDIEGNSYKVIKIGDQLWMAENLKTTKFNDGKEIKNIESDRKWTTAKKEAFCWFKNDRKYAEQKNYGVLYNWNVAINTKICPVGWHVPTSDEWAELDYFLGGKVLANEKIKTKSGWRYNDEKSNGTNESGFTAIPAGYRNGANGVFKSEGCATSWWSSTPALNFKNNAQDYRADARIDFGGLYNTWKTSGKYIRCVKD